MIDDVYKFIRKTKFCRRLSESQTKILDLAFGEREGDR